MINRYTADRKPRSDDAYTPGGQGGARPLGGRQGAAPLEPVERPPDQDHQRAEYNHGDQRREAVG